MEYEQNPNPDPYPEPDEPGPEQAPGLMKGILLWLLANVP